MACSARPDNRCEILTPPNLLKAKVGGNFSGIDEAAIARAEAVVEHIKAEHGEWLAGDVVCLCRAWATYDAAPDSEENISALYRASHDLRGQAATFDFPAISRATHSLCQLIEAVGTPQTLPRALIRAHVEAVAAMYREKGRDCSDPLVADLIEELESKVQLARRITSTGWL